MARIVLCSIGVRGPKDDSCKEPVLGTRTARISGGSSLCIGSHPVKENRCKGSLDTFLSAVLGTNRRRTSCYEVSSHVPVYPTIKMVTSIFKSDSIFLMRLTIRSSKTEGSSQTTVSTNEVERTVPVSELVTVILMVFLQVAVEENSGLVRVVSRIGVTEDAMACTEVVVIPRRVGFCSRNLVGLARKAHLSVEIGAELTVSDRVLSIPTRIVSRRIARRASTRDITVTSFIGAFSSITRFEHVVGSDGASVLNSTICSISATRTIKRSMTMNISNILVTKQAPVEKTPEVKPN